jgi:flagellar basal body rod protein FlgG
MDIGLFRGVAAMGVAERRMEAITTNLANARTAGFKRHAGAHHGFQVGPADAREFGIESIERIDFSQGTLERTDEPLDLALEGEGFFAVSGPSGELYTRDGSFRMTQDGELVTAEGYPLAWASRRGAADPIGVELHVDARGVVRQGGTELGQLKLVGIDALDRVQLSRDGYFTADPAVQRRPALGEVHQGALESSNVSPIDELVHMITVQRSFESAANLLSKIDQSYQRLHQRR